jgi:hypothetical protein
MADHKHGASDPKLSDKVIRDVLGHDAPVKGVRPVPSMPTVPWFSKRLEFWDDPAPVFVEALRARSKPNHDFRWKD